MNARAASGTAPVSILVIEHASHSLPWIEREGSGHLSALGGQLSPDVIVVSQLASEPPALFATRVMRRIGRLDRSSAVARAALVCGPRSDEVSLAARARVAQALLAATQGSPFAKVTLAAPQRASDQLRRQLLAIAGTILEQARAPGANISVQLGDGGSARHAGVAESARQVA